MDVEALHTRARAAWPGVNVALERFAAYLRERLPEGAGEDALGEMFTDDLYLACACLDGDRAALEAFERAMFDAAGFSMARFDLGEAERKDLAQSLRLNFFARKAIARYSGRGALRGWVRSAATRAALDLVAARKQRPDNEDEILGALPALGDPELHLLRERFAAQFKEAFAATMAALEAEDRALLAQHYVDGLTIDQLAVVLGVHRATAARRIVRVRALLLDGTRERLERTLDIDTRAFDSLMRLAQSRLHISVFRLLRE